MTSVSIQTAYGNTRYAGKHFQYHVWPEAFERLTALSKLAFRPQTACHHYLYMAKRSVEQLKRDGRVRLKTYMYAIRPTLCCQWIIKKMEQPPMHIDNLLAEVTDDLHFKDQVNQLIAQKKAHAEKYTVKRSEVIENYINKKSLNYKTTYLIIPGNRDGISLTMFLDQFLKTQTINRHLSRIFPVQHDVLKRVLTHNCRFDILETKKSKLLQVSNIMENKFRTVSILIPVYNEADTIKTLFKAVLAVPLPIKKEIIIIDDGSTDGTYSILERLKNDHPNFNLLRNEKNRGKGYALHCGIKAATGEIILIQDADLEYDPNEYMRLLQPILEYKADAVYGSRFISNAPKRVLYFRHYIGNRILTFISNIFSNFNLSDMETCYKVFTSSVLKRIRLQEYRFGFEPEVTYKISIIKQLRLYEIGISYHGRSYEEGKKIGWKDGVRALYVILKYPLLKFIFGKKIVFHS